MLIRTRTWPSSPREVSILLAAMRRSTVRGCTRRAAAASAIVIHWSGMGMALLCRLQTNSEEMDTASMRCRTDVGRDFNVYRTNDKAQVLRVRVGRAQSFEK